MSLGPILPGRIPPLLMTDRLISNLDQANRTLADLQDQLATGRKFLLPSESPNAALRTISLQRTIERRTTLESNVAQDRSLLGATETSLASVGDVLTRAKAIILAGTGDTATSTEKQALATEVDALIQQVVNTANTEFRGRYLFGGSETERPPFEIVNSNQVRYLGDDQNLNTFVDAGLLLANNIDGNTAFGAVTDAITRDIDPALTLDTKISDLYGGQGVTLGSVVVTLTSPADSQTVDLAGAQTIRDIKNRIEDAFGTANITVDVGTGTGAGIRLTAAAGTVQVTDLSGSNVARNLGLVQSATATVNGNDLNPQLTLLTNLSDLNGGSGIGTTIGNGLSITNGGATKTVDISSATTIEDLFNLLEAEDLDLNLQINDAGNGLAITSRLSGSLFSIGENNGANAAGLGIRTFDGTTLLEDLNRGLGVPVNEVDENGVLLSANLEVTRRDGTNATVDLKGLKTVQQVLDAINAVDPGVLVASLNSVGNGITLVDDDGSSTGPLIVADNALARALGISGSETSGVALTPLVGQEINPQEPSGLFSILVALEQGLRNEDNQELNRLNGMIDDEIQRFNLVRGEVGSRLQLLDTVENRLLDEHVFLEESLSLEFDADITEVISRLSVAQATLQGTLQVGASTLQLSLLNFL